MWKRAPINWWEHVSLSNVCDVIIGQFDEVTNHVRGGLEAVLREAVPKASERSRQQDDHQVTKIWNALGLPPHARPLLLLCMTSGCLAQ